MTAVAKSSEKIYVDHVKPRHSTQSQRLRTLMDEAERIRLRYEQDEISAEEALKEIASLKARHRTLFQRILGF